MKTTLTSDTLNLILFFSTFHGVGIHRSVNLKCTARFNQHSGFQDSKENDISFSFCSPVGASILLFSRSAHSTHFFIKCSSFSKNFDQARLSCYKCNFYKNIKQFGKVLSANDKCIYGHAKEDLFLNFLGKIQPIVPKPEKFIRPR